MLCRRLRFPVRVGLEPLFGLGLRTLMPVDWIARVVNSSGDVTLRRKLARLLLVYASFSPMLVSAADIVLPPALAAIRYEGGDGGSIEAAVIIKHADDDLIGTKAEYVWLRQAFPGLKLVSQQLLHEGGKAFDRMEFSTADGSIRTIYFDISDSFGKY